MNREILFKGKRLDNGEWLEGFYAHWSKGGGYIALHDLRHNNFKIEVIGNVHDAESIAKA